MQRRDVEYLLHGDEREVAIHLLRRARTYLPDTSSIDHDVKIFLDWRIDDKEEPDGA